MRCLTQRELACASGGSVNDLLEMMDGIMAGVIDGEVNAISNLIPNTLSGVVKLSAVTLTGLTQTFFTALGALIP